MKVFVQSKNNMPFDYDTFSAMYGFKQRGFEIVFFNNIEELKTSDISDVIVGGVGAVSRRLADFNLKIDDVDYPECLQKYLGRKIWKSTINKVNSNPDSWPIFVKSISNKKLKGRVIESTKDLIGCGSIYHDEEIYCSEVIDIISEYRVFVLYDEILDVRRYYGEWDVCPDRKIIENCINDFIDAPAAYALDFGVTKTGKTVLIEVNNTCSIGSYGLEPTFYARFISARWAEITGTIDECK